MGVSEDKLTGVRLVDLDASRVALDERGVTIENFTPSGPPRRPTSPRLRRHQRARAASPSMPTICARRRSSRRARAVASGELTLVWEGCTLAHRRSQHRRGQHRHRLEPTSRYPTLDVIEINRPGEEDEPLEDEQPVRRQRRDDAQRQYNGLVRVPHADAASTRNGLLTCALAAPRRIRSCSVSARAQRGTLALSQDNRSRSKMRSWSSMAIRLTRASILRRRDTADLTARVRLIGTRDPEITFTSDPALPEDEILPQILFGRSVEDLSAARSGAACREFWPRSGRACLIWSMRRARRRPRSVQCAPG